MCDSNKRADLILYVPPKNNNSSRDQIDLREQLTNERRMGSFQEIQLPSATITTVHGIMTDVDPALLDPKAFGLESFGSPDVFYIKAIRPMLVRHPTLAKAHVRCSGNGLHVIYFLDKALPLRSETEQTEWAARTVALQRLLPSDPNCRGITAVTRPIGSVNGKNNSKVYEITAGHNVSAEELVTLCQELAIRPFLTLANILFGSDQITPCPGCKKPESRLGVRDREGHCYNCDKVNLEVLFNFFYSASNTKKGG